MARGLVRQARMYAAHRLVVDAMRWDDGTVSIEGQDLGPHTPGGEEYEYFLYVRPGDVPLLLAALDGRPDDDAVDLLAAQGEVIVRHGETRWLTEHDVPYDIQTW